MNDTLLQLYHRLPAVARSVGTYMAGRVAELSHKQILVAGGTLLYFAYLAVLVRGFGFELFISDVQVYWRMSFLNEPFHSWFVPAYPAVIAVLRGLTFEVVSPTVTMIAICWTFFVVSLVTVHKLCSRLGVESPLAIALMFAVYPFVGLNYSVYPVADSMATALLLLSLLLFHERKWTACAVVMSFALLTHKAMWPFMAVLITLGWFAGTRARMVLTFAPVPLLLLVISGWLHGENPLWFMQQLQGPRQALPVLDGIVAPLVIATPAKIAKLTVVLVVVGLSIWIVAASIGRRFLLGVAVGLPLILLVIMVKETEIWGVVRFSKVLVVPLAYLTHDPRGGHVDLMRGMLVKASWAVIAIGLLTNLAFGYYAARFYFS